jgi:hypothetical protein
MSKLDDFSDEADIFVWWLWAENYYCMYWRAEDAFNPMPWIVGERKNPQ